VPPAVLPPAVQPRPVVAAAAPALRQVVVMAASVLRLAARAVVSPAWR
jgi:hypothetical protein